MSNDTKNELVQNGTTMDHDGDASASDIEQGLGQIRVFETDEGILITHHVTARERFFSDYSKFAVKTAQSTVEMCRVIFEAKKSLEKSEYTSFLKDVGHKSEDSTIRKYLAIGERYDDLIAATNLLPSSWTSIYVITQIPAESFMAMVATGESMAHLTGAELKRLKSVNSCDTTVDSTLPLMPSTNVKKSVTASSSTDESEQSVDSDSTDTTVDAADAAFAAHKTVSATSDAISKDDEDSDSSSDNEFAEHATSSLLERVSQNANLTVEADDLEVADEDDDQPYELIIRFKSRPSDDAAHAIVEALLSVFSEQRVNAEVASEFEILKDAE